MSERNANPYDRRYAEEALYWGTEPSSLCDRLRDICKPSSDRRLALLDLGCGEGRNAIYLARLGFEVTGLDRAPTGLTKMLKWANKEGLTIRSLEADLNTVRLARHYDVIFSTGTLHYLAPSARAERFDHFRSHTSPSGIHAFSVLVAKPFIPTAPDAEANAFLFRSGELFGYYWDWEILHCEEEIFACNSSGVPHHHAVNRMIARRPPGG